MKKIIIGFCALLLLLVYFDLFIRQPWIEHKPVKTEVVTEQNVTTQSDTINHTEKDTINTLDTDESQKDNTTSDTSEITEATQQRIINFLDNYTDILNNEDLGRISEFKSMFYNYNMLSKQSEDIDIEVDKKISYVSTKGLEMIDYKLLSIDSVDGDFYDVTLEVIEKYNEDRGITMTIPAKLNVSETVTFVEDFVIVREMNLLEGYGLVNQVFSYDELTLYIEERYNAIAINNNETSMELEIDIQNSSVLSYLFTEENESLFVIELSNGEVIEKSMDNKLLNAKDGRLVTKVDIEYKGLVNVTYPIKFIYMKNVVSQDDVRTSQLLYGSDYDSFNSKQVILLDELK